MAAFAYVFLPVTGLVAYFRGRDRRARFHGLQAIAYGTLWPAALWLTSFITAGAVQITFGVGVLVWLTLLAGTAAGRDPRLPLLAGPLKRAAEAPPTGAP